MKNSFSQFEGKTVNYFLSIIKSEMKSDYIEYDFLDEPPGKLNGCIFYYPNNKAFTVYVNTYKLKYLNAFSKKISWNLMLFKKEIVTIIEVRNYSNSYVTEKERELFQKCQNWLKKRFQLDYSIKDLNTLRNLDLSKKKLINKELYHLDYLSLNLHNLSLSHTNLTDKGLRHIEWLTNLRNLNLSFTKITDKGLKYIIYYRKLETLNLSHTQITSKGLIHLKDLVNLTRLDLRHTQVKTSQIKELNDLLPYCKIIF